MVISQFKSIEYELKNNIGIIKLNKPDTLNAMDDEIKKDLNNILDEIKTSKEVKAVIITGNGKAFSAGGDIKSLEKVNTFEEGRERIKRLHELLKKIIFLEKPIIAAVNGYAVGAGFNLVLACDIILASREAKFSEIFSRIGLIPDAGGMFFLPRLIGSYKAKELIFTGEIFDAEVAEKIGIVNRIVEPEDLLVEAEKLAEKLATGPSTALGLAKTIINNSMFSGLDDLLEQEAFAQGVCFMSPDFREGISAFKEKRRPNFNGGE